MIREGIIIPKSRYYTDRRDSEISDNHILGKLNEPNARVSQLLLVAGVFGVIKVGSHDVQSEMFSNVRWMLQRTGGRFCFVAHFEI